MTSLWSELHQPHSELEIVVAKKRVADVKEFLVGTAGRTRRLLVLRGPPGCGKAATLKGLCADLGLALVEWSPASRGPVPRGAGGQAGAGAVAEPLSDVFLRFLAQTDRYRGLAASGERPDLSRRLRVALVRDFPFTLIDASRGDDAQARTQDFLDRFQGMVNSGAVHRAVFCFNDAFEDHRAVVRLFSQVSPGAMATVHFDGVPRTFAQKALNGVVKAEALDMPSSDVAILAAECGGDLRHAMNALQLAAGGMSRGFAPSAASRPTKRARGNGAAGRGAARGGKVALPIVPSQLTQCSQNGVLEDDAGAAEDTGGRARGSGMRLASLGLFHALGRLLYCKRIPPPGWEDPAATGSAAKRPRKSDDGAPAPAEPRQLPPHLLIPKATRPPLYFIPEEVIDTSNSEPPAVVDWVFTNAPRFFGDITDLAEFAGSMAETDAWGSSAWQPNNQVAVASPMDGLASSVQVRSMLDANLHPVPPTFADPCGAPQEAQTPAAASFNMARPLMRDVMRHRDRRQQEIEAHLQLAGPLALGCANVSQKLIVQVLPLVHMMLVASRGTHHKLRHLPHGLMKLNMELSAPIDGSIMRTGVGDGPARRMEAEEATAVERWDTALAEDPIED